MAIEDEELVMPFGKYKGRKLGDLPLSYLRWLAENIDEDKPMNRRICLAADRLYQSLKD